MRSSMFNTVVFSSGTNSSGGNFKEKNSQKIALLPIAPNLAHRKLIDLANYVPSSSLRGVVSFNKRFFKSRKNGGPVRKNLVRRVLRRMKACIDESRPNTSQENYFEGF